MSRIIVKDIPEYVIPDRLRELFSQKGEITDVQLMHNIRFGRFAFIEFRTDHEAQEAVQCFNRSYIDTSVITCELAPLDFDYGAANNDFAQRTTFSLVMLPTKPLVKKKRVSDPCRLFIFFLPLTTTEKELEELFSPFGTVTEVRFVISRCTKKFNGMAFVSFSNPQSAARASKSLTCTTYKGVDMTVVPAIQRPSNNEEENSASIDQGSKTLKQLREEESKVVDAAFMRPNTVKKQFKNGKNVQMAFGPTVCSTSCSI